MDSGSGSQTAKFKAAAHWFAASLFAWIVGAQAFAQSNAGQALIHQYPKLAPAAGIVAAIGTAAAAARAVYFQAKG